jgi:hypothetical protein
MARLAAGWRPLAIQVSNWRRLERAGLVRADYGPDGTPDGDKLCLYLTQRGRAALAKAEG